MDILKAIILGIVEGITEFLPVSSTGHLILVNEFVQLEPAGFANAFNVMIQLGAIFAVVVLYFHRLNPFTFSRKHNPRLPRGFESMNAQSKVFYAVKYRNPETMRIWKLVIIGVLPAVVLGLLFDDLIDRYLFRPQVVALTLFFWGVAILVIETLYKSRHARLDSVHQFDWRIAIAIGLFQCLAMVPGTSRSAATIIGAMILGSSRTAAAEFSFFLAIPTMLGATLLKIIKSGLNFTPMQWIVVLVGATVSFVVAMVVIRAFMGFIKKNDFRPFGIYRILLASAVFLYFVI